jgi:translation initiation factor eIF-2B subunit gamma
VLLPCDVVPPSEMTLASILDKHRASPEAILTSVLYEPIEAVKEGEEKLLVGLSEETEEVLVIHPLEGMDEDMDLRMELITS